MKIFAAAITLLFLFGYPINIVGAKERTTLTIAVAANFTAAMEQITAAYEKESGAKVQAVYSSTGKLYAQIKNSAPYDIFLAADARRPELLAGEGLCEEPFVYATGRAVLWSRVAALAGEKRWQDAVARDGGGRIAIASPETAPYGAAVLAALKETGLYPRIEDKLVYGQNVAQPFQYAYQGSADLGFTALSFALSDQGREGTYWPIPEAPPVVQKGCLVKNSTHREEAANFLAFLKRPEAGKILTGFGYR